jgi:diguanylate cyclase (GGDEF)-like protein/PAS domain S-box-containing protein
VRKVSRSRDSSIEPSAPRSVHIVDTTNGPLCGDGKWERVMPFAVTATISLLVAVPAASWVRPGFGVAGCLLGVATIIGALTIPWQRLARITQLAPPFLFLVATLLLITSAGQQLGSPFITMTVLPLMWLALYETRAAVIAATLVAGVGLWLSSLLGNVDVPDHWIISIAVFFICAVGMGVTLHGLVADARLLTRSLRDHQIALEHAAGMLDALPERVNRYRMSDHVITYCNAAWATQYHDPAHALGRPLDEFLSDDELEGLHSQLAILGPDSPILVDNVARAVHNAPGIWLEWADRYLTGPEGAEVLSVGRDVTGRHVAELKLAESETRFRDLADKSADVVWRFIIEPHPHFDYISPSVENILGYPPSYFIEDFSRMVEVLDGESRVAIDRALDSKRIPTQFDFHFRHANGSIVIGETRTTLIAGGVQGVSRDVTELRQLQESMAALALHDPLTGLANRRLFNELLEADLARTQRNGLPLAVAFLDLDGFKKVNDTYGHEVGDLVLCEIARRLVVTVRGTDTVGRLGGDEFVIVYEPNDANSHNLIPRIELALSAPIQVTPDIVVHCPASVGVADSRTVGHDATQLLAAADDAMYEAKRARTMHQATLVRAGA